MFAAVATGAIVAFQSRRVTIFGRWVRHHVAGPVEADDLNEDLRNFGDSVNRPLADWAWLDTLRVPLSPWIVILAGFLAADVVVLLKGCNAI